MVKERCHVNLQQGQAINFFSDYSICDLNSDAENVYSPRSASLVADTCSNQRMWGDVNERGGGVLDG